MKHSLRKTSLLLASLLAAPAVFGQAFADLADNGDGTYTNWIGTFAGRDGAAVSLPGWIDHAEHGLLYVQPNGEQVWLYDPNVKQLGPSGWIYTDRFVHPWFYIQNPPASGFWARYLPGVAGPEATPRIFTRVDGSPLLLAKRDYRNLAELASDKGLSTLVAAVGAADAAVATALTGAGPLTVFAPTNDAFAALGDTLTDLLMPANQGRLTDILTYHVVAGEITADDLVFDPEDLFSGESQHFWLTALNGDPIEVDVTPLGVLLNGGALVSIPDVYARNGVVHVIDQVLLPPMDLAETASSLGFDSLVAAVGSADPAVGDALTGSAPLTVFAPTDAAFAAASSITATLDQAGLTDVLLYHVVPGALTAEDLTFDASDLFNGESSTLFATTANGADLRIDVTPMGVWLNETAMVSTPNVVAKNGIIHAIDGVLLPPENLATLASNAGFSELVAAVSAANPTVAAALTGDQPLTVFAPTDEAFQAIASTVAGLDQATLTEILLYHVVPGRVYASEVPLDTPIATANTAGDTITVTKDMNGVLHVQDAQILSTNIVAGNGVIHVIDKVILPPME